jgi:hypothetical protein
MKPRGGSGDSRADGAVAAGAGRPCDNLRLAVSCGEGRATAGDRTSPLHYVADSRDNPQPQHRSARSLDSARSASVFLVYLGHDSPAAIELEQ